MANEKMLGSAFPSKASDQLKARPGSYGENGFSGPSSETTIGSVRADMSVGGNRDIDPVLARVAREGMKRTDQVNAAPIKPAGNMRNPNDPAEKVPGSVAWGDPVKAVRK